MQQPLFDDIPAGSVINAIEPLASDPNVRSVRVGKRTVARLWASDAEALGLAVGKRWTAALARRVAHAVEATAARKAAMNMLGKRAMSRGELIERLLNRGHAKSIAQQVANELAADHWIDDAEYARSLAAELVRTKSASRALIVDRLEKRRIDSALALRIADEALGQVDSLEKAVEFAKQKQRTMRSLPAPTAARRIAAALTRRGYDEETVRDALAQIGLDLSD